MAATSHYRFAWNGISFDLPRRWELSEHRTTRGVTRIAMEDATAVRLECEWLYPRRAVEVETVRERYLDRAKALSDLAEQVDPLPTDALGWTGHFYRMGEQRTLVIAYYQSAAAEAPFVFLRLHFDATSTEEPAAAFRMLARSFQFANDGLIPWACYDVSFLLDHRFRLTGSSLDAGRKLLVFGWGLRRLCLWHFSLADVIRERGTLAEFAANAVNTSRSLPAVQVKASGPETLAWRRKRRYPIGHAEEIGRWCFRYYAGLCHLPERNQLAIWVFNYRKPDDLTVFREGFRPGEPIA